ncbi:Ubiquitin carboxyl-terminal hydrolase 2, partial [Cucurbita argyrosperma subsp. sororia]
MGKKVKKKNNRAPLKEKRVSSSSPRKVPQRSSPTVEIAVEDVSVVKERSQCQHLDKCFNFKELSSKLASSEPISCEDCQDSSADRRGSKGKAKHGKKKGGTSVDVKPDAKAIWICLQCGHYACGGIGLPTNSQIHAVRHVRQTRHPVVIQFENPQLRWCFSCNKLLPVEKTDENGEQSDGLSNVVKLIRDRSIKASPVDIENTWHASSEVTAATKSECSMLSDLEGRNHYVVKGLINLGNTCFFNSILQNLLAIDMLRDHFMKLEECVGPLTIALKKIFIEARMEGRMKGSINPRSVFGCISSKAPQFKGYEQHDSHELLHALLDGLSTEELTSRKMTKSKEERMSGNPTPSFVDEMFGGEISSAVCCKECGHTSTVYEPFLNLSLPVPMKKPLAKKVQPVSRAKKTKVPPKSSGKTIRKTGKPSDVVPVQIASLPSSSNELSLASEASAASSTTTITEKTLSSQNVSDVKEPEKEVLIENGGECASDNLTWMDFLGPELTVENCDISTTQESENNVEVFISDDSQSISGSGMQVSTLHNEPNQGPDFSVNSWDESPLQVQASEVLLLPYKEESSTAEVAKADDQASSSILGCAQDDFEGFGLGDMFDEPEIPIGPIARPSAANEVAESSFVSESEPEEVDNTNAPVSVESCLTYFTKPELLSNENGYNCEKCSKRLQQQRLEMKKQSKVARKAVANGYQTDVGGDISSFNVDSSVEVKNQRNMNLINGSLSHSSGESSNLKENADCSSRDRTKPVDCQKGKMDSLVLNEDEAKVDKDMNPGLAYASGCNNTSNQENSDDKSGSYLSNDDPKGRGLAKTNIESLSSQISAENQPEKSEDCEMNSDSTIVNVKRDATKRFLIHKAPPILTVHIKRFSPDARGRYSKLNGHVKFKETIDLKPYMDTRCADRDKCKYRLVGVVEHSGSMRGGHYVAYVRGGNRKRRNGEAEEDASVWYYASDACVNEVSLDRVLGCEAYILFYEITGQIFG